MRRVGASILIAASLGFALPAAPVNALPPNCVQQPWMIVLRMTTRTICDGPLYADGSWLRRRLFYAPQSWVPITCSRYSCTGGYWLNEYTDFEEYPVHPDTVLPDEPGWIAH